MSVLRVLVVARRFFHRGDDTTSAENEIRGQVPRSRTDVDWTSHTGEDACARRALASRVGPPPGVSVVQEAGHAGSPYSRISRTRIFRTHRLSVTTTQWVCTYRRAPARYVFVVAHRKVL